MAYSYRQVVGDGSTTFINVTFPYLHRDHIKVYVDNVPQVLQTDFYFTVNNDVVFYTAPANGAIILVKRETPIDSPYFDFTNGSTLTEDNLDKIANQILYITQEAVDAGDHALASAAAALASELAAAASASAAAAAQAAAAASEAAASGSASAAAAAQAAAEVARDAAQAAAAASEAAQIAAAASAAAASTSETNASLAEAAAAASKVAAEAARDAAQAARDAAQAAQAAAESAAAAAAASAAAAAASALTAQGMNALEIGNINNPLVHLPLKNSLGMPIGAGTLSYTRSSTASTISRYGSMSYVGNDVPRFEKNGLLIEGASTNLNTYSQDLTQAAWVKDNVTISAAGTNPDGSAGQKVISSATTNWHRISRGLSVSSGVGSYTWSVWVNKIDYQYFYMDIDNSGAFGAGISHMVIDLNTQSIVTSGGWADVRISEPVGGFIRISGTATPTSTGVATIRYGQGASSTPSTYLGDGTSGNLYFGFQTENLPFATSYIYTTTATVTRSADVVTLTPSENIPLQADECTICADVVIASFGTPSGWAQGVFGVPGETYRKLFVANSFNPDNRPDFTYGSASVIPPGTAVTLEARTRFGMTHDGSGGLEMFKDGVSIGTATGSDVSDALGTDIVLGGVAATGTTSTDWPLFGHLSNFRIYDRVLTDNEIRVA